MKSSFIAICAVLGFATVSHASVTLALSRPIAGAIPSNFANGAGVVTNGMQWGIIIDTSGNGFSNTGTSYDAYTAGVTTSGFLSANGSVTDDYYFAGELTVATVDFGGDTELNGTIPGNGSIVHNNDLSVGLTNGISQGDAFALAWFGTNSSTAGSKYGFFTDALFVIPADGSNSPFDAPFVGNDPIRTASNTFASAVAPIPEPSRVLLLGVGALGLISRRRRKVA